MPEPHPSPSAKADIARFGMPIERRLLVLRGERVILDADLAELYKVTTKALNQAVKRNRDRFPGDFAFGLTAGEKRKVVTDVTTFGRSDSRHPAPRPLPSTAPSWPPPSTSDPDLISGRQRLRRMDCHP